MRLRTANKHRRANERRTIDYINMGWPFGVMKRVTFVQAQRRPRRVVWIDAKQFWFGPFVSSSAVAINQWPQGLKQEKK